MPSTTRLPGHSAHGGLLLPELQRRPGDAKGGAGLYPRRCIQADAGLQGSIRALPSGLQRAVTGPRNAGLSASLGFGVSRAWESIFCTLATSTTIPIRAIRAPSGLWKRRFTLKGRGGSPIKTFWSCRRRSRMRILGGHWYLLTPKPVYFSHAEPRAQGPAVRGG